MKVSVAFTCPLAHSLYSGRLSKAHPEDAGWDLRYVGDAPAEIHPGRVIGLETGIRIALPPYYEAQVRPRSGLAIRYGVTVLNSPGTIDAGYRGQIVVILFRHTDMGGRFVVEPGDRIAQLVITKLPLVFIEHVNELPDGDRGDAGFGSTGVR